MAELDIMEKLSKLGWGSEAADAVRFFYSIVRVRYIRGINEANYPDRPWWAWYGVFLENDQTSQKYYGALPPLESDWLRIVAQRFFQLDAKLFCREFWDVMLRSVQVPRMDHLTVEGRVEWSCFR